MGAKRISVFGIEASFHDVAAKKYFGEKSEIIYCNSFYDTCKKLADGDADFCVLAIENSIAGAILPNYKLMSEFNLLIDAELFLHIELNMMVAKGVSIDEISEIHSHPMAILQSEKFLQKFSDKKIVPLSDTAACARNVSENNLKHVGVIAGEACANQYGLEILFNRIETNRNNFTRFLILSKKGRNFSKATRATVSFQSGKSTVELKNLTKIFAKQEIEIESIHSLPLIEKPELKVIYLDLRFKKPEKFSRAFIKAKKKSLTLNLSGIYHSGKHIN